MNKKTSNDIILKLKEEIPEYGPELNFTNNYELIVAVMLSQQTTDKRVNIVTKDLFRLYPDIKALSCANYNDVYKIIEPLGLAKNKTINIIEMAKIVNEKYSSIIPNEFDTLITLPGVGRKTANVVLALGLKIPALPVDTHVYRVAKRLGYITEDDSLLKCENTLKKYIEIDDWIDSHHLFLLHGRYFCKSLKPKCDICLVRKYCKYMVKSK